LLFFYPFEVLLAGGAFAFLFDQFSGIVVTTMPVAAANEAVAATFRKR
jgi:hypothetical protein